MMQDCSGKDVGGGRSAFIYGIFDDLDAAVLFHLLNGRSVLVIFTT